MNAIETPFHFLLECNNRKLELLRQPIIDRLGINLENKTSTFKDIMTGNIQSKDSFFIYKNIYNMYEKRKSNELDDDSNLYHIDQATNIW